MRAVIITSMVIINIMIIILIIIIIAIIMIKINIAIIITITIIMIVITTTTTTTTIVIIIKITTTATTPAANPPPPIHAPPIPPPSPPSPPSHRHERLSPNTIPSTSTHITSTSTHITSTTHFFHITQGVTQTPDALRRPAAGRGVAGGNERNGGKKLREMEESDEGSARVVRDAHNYNDAPRQRRALQQPHNTDSTTKLARNFKNLTCITALLPPATAPKFARVSMDINCA